MRMPGNTNVDNDRIIDLDKMYIISDIHIGHNKFDKNRSKLLLSFLDHVRSKGPGTGLIIDGRVHAHITLSNTDTALGGHLEEGCKVLTFSVVVIAETPNVRLTEWDRVGTL